MRHKKLSNNRNRTPTSESRPTRDTARDQGEADFTPAPDEVARRAYFSYVNQGSLPGHDVQHWLEAEAQLLEERNLTRIHGFHNRT